MFMLFSAALATPTFAEHLDAQPPTTPSLEDRRRYTKRSIAPVVVAGWSTAAVGTMGLGLGVALFPDSVLYDDPMPSLLTMAGGLSLIAGGTIVGTLSTVKLGHDLKKHDRDTLRPPPRITVRPTGTGLTGTF